MVLSLNNLKYRIKTLLAKRRKRYSNLVKKENNISCNLDRTTKNSHSNDQQNNSGGDSLLSIFSLKDDNGYDATLTEELQAQKRKKKKRKGIRR